MAKRSTTIPSCSTKDADDVPEAVTNASGRILEALRTEILTGAIRPGERLRQEDIAERLGGSRIPVREALRMLAAEGLVEIEPNKGARVPQLDRDEVETLYRMRERLEPLALSTSLPLLEVEQIDAAERLQERIEAGVDVIDFLALDREFHMTTYAGCRDEQLMATIERLWNSTQHYRRAFMEAGGPGRAWVINAEHRLLLDALRQGDSEGAELHLLGHIRRTRRELSAAHDLFE